MYSITYGQYLLYDPRLAEEGLMVIDPKTSLGVGKAGAMSFTLRYNHPYLQNLRRMSGYVELCDGATPIYRGRITKDTTRFDKSHRIDTEGLMACLNDSLIPPFKFPEDFEADPEYQSSTNHVEYLWRWGLGLHNDNVSTEQQLKPGRCTVTDPNNYIVRSSSEYMTTMDFMREKLSESSLGGYLMVRYESDGTYLDYLSELPLTNTQRVEYAENLLDLTDTIDGTGIYTAILPIGKDGLTIEDIPDGNLSDDLVKSGKTIFSRSAVASYGRITKCEKWPDVTIPENLQTRAVASLASGGIMMPETIECKAVDLGWREGEQHFREGRMTVLMSLPHGYEAAYPLMSLELDILHPGSTKITLGGAKRTFIGDLHAADQAHREDIQDTDRQLEELATSTTEQMTEIVKNSEAMMSKALEDYVTTGDFGRYQETVQTIIQQTADNVTVEITKTTDALAQQNGELQEQYNSVSKYFRFEEGGLYIGESGNDVQLRLDNDTIQFLRNNVPMLQATERGLSADEISARTVRSGPFVWAYGDDGHYSLQKGGN